MYKNKKTGYSLKSLNKSYMRKLISEKLKNKKKK